MNTELIEKVKAILNGIDKTELEDDCGWWETSTGAELGADTLQQIIELLEAET